MTHSSLSKAFSRAGLRRNARLPVSANEEALAATVSSEFAWAGKATGQSNNPAIPRDPPTTMKEDIMKARGQPAPRVNRRSARRDGGLAGLIRAPDTPPVCLASPPTGHL